MHATLDILKYFCSITGTTKHTGRANKVRLMLQTVGVIMAQVNTLKKIILQFQFQIMLSILTKM